MSEHPHSGFPSAIAGARDYFGHVMATFNAKCIGCGDLRSLHYQGEVCGGFGAVMDAKGARLPWFSDYSGPLERPARPEAPPFLGSNAPISEMGPV